MHKPPTPQRQIVKLVALPLKHKGDSEGVSFVTSVDCCTVKIEPSWSLGLQSASVHRQLEGQKDTQTAAYCGCFCKQVSVKVGILTDPAGKWMFFTDLKPTCDSHTLRNGRYSEESTYPAHQEEILMGCLPANLCEEKGGKKIQNIA